MSREAIQPEGIAEAKGILEMNDALAGSGDGAMAEPKIEEMIIIREKRSGAGRGR